MQLEATGTTHKTALGTAIGTGLMPAAATRLRGMPRVHLGHHHPAFLRFVREKRGQLRKRPAMHAALGLRLPFGTHPLANIGQVFEYQGPPRGHRPSKLLRQDMIAVASKARLGMSEIPQVALGTLCAAVLQPPLEAKVPPVGRFPGVLADKLIGRCHRGLGHPQINPDHLFRLGNDVMHNSDEDKQPPATILILEQVSRIN